MIDQKNVCNALAKELNVSPIWEGNTCKIDTEDATLIVDEHAGVELKVKNPQKGQQIIQVIRKVYKEL